MKCPYCSSDMKSGYIPSGRDFLEWVPEGEKPSIAFFKKGEGRIKLTETPIMSRKNISGFVCYKCKKIIIDYENKKVDNKCCI